jgi:S-formylglutathione hydrolase
MLYYKTGYLGVWCDVGLEDEFYEAGELLPENLIAACDKSGQPIKLRFQEGYDHSYHFVATFMGEHLKYHHYLTNR